MFEKFWRLFSRKPAAPSPPAAENPFAQPVWIEAGESPFKVRMLDCRSFSRSMLATTGDPQIATSFLALRNSAGEQHRGKAPAGALPTECNLRYPCQGEVQDGRVFGAEEMEDKWDIYLYDGLLYFARSWTGELFYRARIDFVGGEAIVSFIEAKADLLQEGAAFVLRVVDFLIKSHLFGREVPHPLHQAFPDDPQQIALFSFSQYDRRASYATYEDTVPLGA